MALFYLFLLFVSVCQSQYSYNFTSDICTYTRTEYYNGNSVNTYLCECIDNTSLISTFNTPLDSCIITETWNVTSAVTGLNPYGNASTTNPLPFDIIVSLCPNLVYEGCSDGTWDDVVYDLTNPFSCGACPRCKCNFTTDGTDGTFPGTWEYRAVKDITTYKDPSCYACECNSYGNTLQQLNGTGAWSCTDVGDYNSPSEAVNFKCDSTRHVYQCASSTSQQDWYLYDPPTATTTCGYGSNTIPYSSYCMYERMEVYNVSGDNGAVCIDAVDNWDMDTRVAANDYRDRYGCADADWSSTVNPPLYIQSSFNFKPRWLAAAFGTGIKCPMITVPYYEYNCNTSTWSNDNYYWKYYLYLCNDKPMCNQLPRHQIEDNCVEDTNLGGWLADFREVYKSSVGTGYWGNRWFMDGSSQGLEYSNYDNNCGYEYTEPDVCTLLRNEKENMIRECSLWQTLTSYIPSRKEFYQTIYDIENEVQDNFGGFYDRATWNGWNTFYGCGLGNLTYCDVDGRVDPNNFEDFKESYYPTSSANAWSLVIVATIMVLSMFTM